MSVRIKLKEFCPATTNFEPLIQFLGTHSKYHFTRKGDELEFIKAPPDTYFEILPISVGDKTNTQNVEALRKWLREYRFPSPFKIEGKDIDKFESRINEKNETKDKLALCTKYLFYSGAEEMDKIIELVKSEAVKIFPNCRMYFMKVHEEINLKTSAMRILFASKEIPDVLVSDRKLFEGVKTLHSLDTQVELGATTTLNPFFGLFPPYLTGISTERVGGAFILIFDKPIECTQPFPGRLQDIIRKDSSYFSENFKTLEEIEKQIEKIHWDVKEIEDLLLDYVAGMNRLYQYLLEPTNYEDQGNKPFLDVLAWHFDNLTIRRMANESLFIETEFMNQFVKRVMLFSIVDQLSSIICNHSKISIKKDGDAFKAFFKKRSLKKMSNICRKYPAPFNNYFGNRCDDAIDKLYKTIIDGIFV
jgi:hypothetical protein